MNTRARTFRFALLAACLVLARPGWAEDTPGPEIHDVLYKGIVGKALDVVPLDPEQRLTLQRTNAVVSNALTGRSLAAWAGLSNPLLMIGGLVYGLFSASRIKANAAREPAQSSLVDGEARLEIAQDRQPVAADTDQAHATPTSAAP